MKNFVISQIKLGSSVSLRAHGYSGANATKNMIAPQKNQDGAQADGQKIEGFGGGNFLPVCQSAAGGGRRLGWGCRPALLGGS